jgi:hypothetical protein
MSLKALFDVGRIKRLLANASVFELSQKVCYGQFDLIGLPLWTN